MGREKILMSYDQYSDFTIQQINVITTNLDGCLRQSRATQVTTMMIENYAHGKTQSGYFNSLRFMMHQSCVQSNCWIIRQRLGRDLTPTYYPYYPSYQLKLL